MRVSKRADACAFFGRGQLSFVALCVRLLLPSRGVVKDLEVASLLATTCPGMRRALPCTGLLCELTATLLQFSANSRLLLHAWRVTRLRARRPFVRVHCASLQSSRAKLASQALTTSRISIVSFAEARNFNASGAEPLQWGPRVCLRSVTLRACWNGVCALYRSMSTEDALVFPNGPAADPQQFFGVISWRPRAVPFFCCGGAPRSAFQGFVSLNRRMICFGNRAFGNLGLPLSALRRCAWPCASIVREPQDSSAPRLRWGVARAERYD